MRYINDQNIYLCIIDIYCIKYVIRAIPKQETMQMVLRAGVRVPQTCARLLLNFKNLLKAY